MTTIATPRRYSGPHAVLLCPTCGGEWSADAGDYCQLADDDKITCCGEPCEFVTARTVYKPVSATA